MLCPVYGHELTPLSCPPSQGVSFRSFKGLIILSPYKLFASIKKSWHVSIAAALYRARELGKLSENAYKSAQIIRSRAGTRLHEENEFQPPLPSLLDQAMRLVCKDTRLDEMASDLGMSVHGLRAILELQNVSSDILDAMTPPTSRAKIIDFAVYRDTD